MHAEPALETNDLSFAYGPKPALDGVSFAAAKGAMTVLLGPNGAGKTTLIGLLTRMFIPARGTIRIGGLDLAREKHRALAPLGIVFQERSLDLDLTVGQNLAYGAALRGLSGRLAEARIARELGRIGLSDKRGVRVQDLNGGHRRRVEIARALLHDPAVLIADEATVGLDIPTRAGVLDHVRTLVEESGLAVLWATHLIDEVRPTDALIVLHRGRIVANGRAADVLAATGAEDLGGAFRALTREASA